MIWSPAQARMLEAMGYEPMQPRPPLWGGPSGPSETVAPAQAAPAAAPSRRLAPAPPPIDALSAPPRAAAAAGNPAAFAAALRRAAGGREVGDLVDDLERLRRDPALKRALWPRLRALRRLQ